MSSHLNLSEYISWLEVATDDELAYEQKVLRYQVEHSLWRFGESLTNLDEVRTMAVWLARATKRPVAIRFTDDAWHFLPSAQYMVKSIEDSMEMEMEKDWGNKYEADTEHWVLNADYYNERLREDPSWGRDGNGVPYASPDSNIPDEW